MTAARPELAYRGNEVLKGSDGGGVYSLKSHLVLPSGDLAGEPGLEPGLTDTESAVLPLDDSPVLAANSRRRRVDSNHRLEPCGLLP